MHVEAKLNVNNMSLTIPNQSIFQALQEPSKTSSEVLNNIRTQALEKIQLLGLVTKKHEDYRYLNFSSVYNQTFSDDISSTVISKQEFSHLIPTFENVNFLVLINGNFRIDLSTVISTNQEITISTLQEAIVNNKSIVEKYLGTKADLNDSFVALNSAYANDGLFIHVPAKSTVENTTVIVHLSDSQTGNKLLVQNRNLFVCEKQSKAQVIELHVSLGNEIGFNNHVTEIFVAENAHFEHFNIQNEHDKLTLVNTTQVHQFRDSVYSNAIFTFNGNIVRNNTNTILDAENILANLWGLFMPSGTSIIDNHTIVDHAKPHCNSNELYKGVLNDKGIGVFNGKIFVREDAQKTNAFQSNRTILLSDEATINTKPQLEIFADDVKCSHGATSGQLDAESLFYLRSRGLSEKSAKALLVNAFASEVLENINNEALKLYLEEQISLKLPY